MRVCLASLARELSRVPSGGAARGAASNGKLGRQKILDPAFPIPKIPTLGPWRAGAIPALGMQPSAKPQLGALDVRAPCSGVPAVSVIAAPGIVAVSTSPVMGASLHAQPELRFAHARVHPWARTWACTLLTPACWRAFQRSGRGDFDGERPALGLAHVALISGEPQCQRPDCGGPQCQNWDSGAPTFSIWGNGSHPDSETWDSAL